MSEPTIKSTAVPTVFLAGPPGSGKTSLGSRVCQTLGLTFLDLSAPAPSAGDPQAGMAELAAAIAGHTADVVALSWSLQGDSRALALARRSGELVLLWAHPLVMQARSGHAEPLFTPVARLRTHGGFGRHGTGCREFRRLERSCCETLLLVGASLEDASDALEDCIVALREDAALGPVGQERMDGWAGDWAADCGASPKAARLLVDAMARYTLHLRSEGTSPRTLSGVYSDLNAAGMLVFMYDAPKAGKVLSSFSSPPCEIEFSRKFSDSPGQTTRYRRTLEGFARFLRRSGLIPDEGEDG